MEYVFVFVFLGEVGDGKREVGVTVKSDVSGGEWVKEVKVGSLWDNTLG